MSFQFIQGVQAKINSAIDGMMNQMGAQAVEYARELVPVDTGQLKASIGYVYRQSDKTLQIYADMPYALIVEFGNATHRAQPYLRPALLKLRGFKLGSVNTEIQFHNATGKFGGVRHAADTDVSRRNVAANAKLNHGLLGKTRVRVRRYEPHRPLS